MQHSEITELRKRLLKEFSAIFGEQALYRYYIGKQKTKQINDSGKVETVMQDFEPHFKHETLADELEIRFMSLHPILQAYFMAYAMDKTTTLERYSSERNQLISAFKSAALKEQMNPDKELTDENLRQIIEELESTADIMIQNSGLTLPSNDPDNHLEPHAA